MRFFKIAKKVAHIQVRRKTLTDKDQVFPETLLPAGQFNDLVRRGFIYEVNAEDKKINTAELDTEALEPDLDDAPEETESTEEAEETELEESEELSSKKSNKKGKKK